MARSSSRGKRTTTFPPTPGPFLDTPRPAPSDIISISSSLPPPIQSVIVVASSSPVAGRKAASPSPPAIAAASPRSSPDPFPELPFFKKKKSTSTQPAAMAAAGALAPIPDSGLNDGPAAAAVYPPHPPPSAQKPPPSRVIQDSDEENYGIGGSDSDSDSFPDLDRFAPPPSSSRSIKMEEEQLLPSSLGDAARRPGTPPSSSSSTTKRRANTLLTSPLPLRRAKHARVARGHPAPLPPPPPKHKFDMQALMRHARQEDATEAAARRVSEALAESEKQKISASEERKRTTEKLQLLESFIDDGAGDALGGKQMTSGRDHDHDHDYDGSESNTTAGAPLNKDRLKKALDRTEAGAVSESWYFFKEHFIPSPIKRRPFPQRAAAEGTRWAFLQDATMRQDYFAMGIVRKALQKRSKSGGSGLPDDLFVWILNEACCMDALPSLRAEYAAVLQCCPDQVRRFVDAERLLLLFQKLGPRWESIDLSTRLELVPTIHRPYPGRDWAPLRSLLHLVATLAEHLSLEAVACAVKILLRLGIDRVVEEHVDLFQGYQEAVRKLAARVSPADWSDFCFDVCASLHSSVQKPALRWQVLASLPLDTRACHDLRRRLAAVLLFDDPERARQDPSRQLAPTHAPQGLLPLSKLVARECFVLTPDTNYPDLSALVNILDVLIDDGGRDAVLYPAVPLPNNNKNKAHTAAQDFDADIDELTRRLKVISRGIEATGGGHISRLETKTALERVHIRLTHTARSRRPGKRNIFSNKGAGGTTTTSSASGASGSSGGDADARTRPKQQDIRSFFLQRLGKKAQS